MYVGWASAKSGLKMSVVETSEEPKGHCSHLRTLGIILKKGLKWDNM